MKSAVVRWAGSTAFVLCFVAIATGCVTKAAQVKEREALKSNNLTRLRAEALTLFPLGSQLDDAESHLTKIGFVCEALPHAMPDISGPSLRCASSGRGYPDYPAVNVIVLSRNGLVSDVDVWNVMARADSEPDGIDFTAIGASAALPVQLRRPQPAEATAVGAPEGDDPSVAGS